MLHTLHIKNFTVFSEAQFQFSEGLNVIIGDNGTGKSHLLYLAYSIESVWHQAWQNYLHTVKNKDKESWQRDLATKLKTVFRPEKLGRLCRRQQPQPAQIKMIPSRFGPPIEEWQTAFIVTKNDTVQLEQSPSFSLIDVNKARLEQPLPLFFPLKEVLSFYPSLRKSYEERESSVYALYYDLCQALTAPPRAQVMAELVAYLEKILQGKVILEDERFYLLNQQHGNIETALMPEGLRKIAMLTYLLQNGSLAKGSTLFWDEPEVGLNAKWQVKLAEILVALVKTGVQVILTTHDLFLMKEFSLRVDAGETQANFFELLQSEQGIRVVPGENLDDLFTITALEATLEQDDREQEIFYRELEQTSA
jgi:ABC-type cobalamin/Fe3+-siderophores transport system ATPase subunit